MLKLNKIFFLIAFIFNSLISFSQYVAIDKAMLEIPKSNSKTIETLVEYINKNSKSDIEKARGAYVWIANNIEYDFRKLHKDKESNYEPEDVFDKKLAICAGFSNLYREMCQQLNIRCAIVNGFTYGYFYNQGQQFNEPSHSWNAIYVDSAWHLVDVTWGIKRFKKFLIFKKLKNQYNDKFFDTEPQEFVLEHLPEIPMWQLLSYPVPMKIFTKGETKIEKYFTEKKSDFYNYKDSIQTLYSITDTIEFAMKYGKMAIEFNPNNKIPLAIGMIKLIDKNLTHKMYSVETDIQLMDSLSTFTENLIKLLKKTKTSRQSIKTNIENEILEETKVLAELNFIRAKHYAKNIEEDVYVQVDTLKFVIKKITKSTIKTINFYKKNNPTRLKEIEDEFCDLTMSLYGILGDKFEKESILRDKKIIKRETNTLLGISKQYISDQCSCKARILMLEKL